MSPLDPLAQSSEQESLADAFAAAKASGNPPPPDLVARAQSAGVQLASQKWRAQCIVASHNYDVRTHLANQRAAWKAQGLSNGEIQMYEFHNLLWRVVHETQDIGGVPNDYWSWAYDVPYEGPPL